MHQSDRYIEDLFSKAVPADAADPSEMEGATVCAATLYSHGDHHERRCNIGGAGRTTVLICDDAQKRPLGAEPQHRFDEICAEHTVDPRGAKNDMMRRTQRRYERPQRN